jgi:TM2 domain-containing membrane protein YozV
VYGFTVVTLDGTVVLSLGFTMTALAAMVLPYRRKDLFKASPASKYMVGKVPLITICGAIWFVFSLWYTYYWVANAAYGVNNPVSAVFLVFCYVATAVFFLAYRWYQKKQGLEMDMIFKEIPSE